MIKFIENNNGIIRWIPESIDGWIYWLRYKIAYFIMPSNYKEIIRLYEDYWFTDFFSSFDDSKNH